MLSTQVEPHLFVILGATGDLARRKLFPSIYRLSAKGALRGKSKILGCARKDLDDRSFRVLARGILESAGFSIDDRIYSPWCDSCLFYQSLGRGSVDDYKELASRIEALEQEYNLLGNRVFYMALPPSVVPMAIEGLGESGLNSSSGWTRIVAEKPFGQDLASTRELNMLIHSYFDESQIYRIDHFLGKETVQNLFVFRFANAFFEHLWSYEHIENIQITVAEDLGIEGRANYYEQTGALCDMVQNHLTQLLTLVAMENPMIFEKDAIRREKIKVLREVAPIKAEDVVFGQYSGGRIGEQVVEGYRNEPRVSKSSQTETFVALKLEIKKKRWKKVPIFIRTGKRMPHRHTRIVVKFHCPPVSIFHPHSGGLCPIDPNVLIITLQPDEGFDLQFQVKSVGQPLKLSTQRLHFRYSKAFGSLPDAYETLLLDVIRGDQTLFVSSEEVEESWRLYSSFSKESIPVHQYSAGSWGPPEADQLLTKHMARWLNK
jgi:glucose-6-phosphate 1-dehydrogenase